MNAPAYIRVQPDGLLLAVKVQPRASRNEVLGAAGAELRVRITAPPVDSAANDGLIRFLAEVLQCGRNQLELVRGHTSRHKTVKVRTIEPALLMARLPQ
jgi:uncharacterized protein (TIGR00251 family)